MGSVERLLEAATAGSALAGFDAAVVSVHDGDTFTVDVALPVAAYGIDRAVGFGLAVHSRRLWLRTKIRLAGCNAAELGTPGGDAAGHNLAGLLPPGTMVRLTGVRVDDYGGRWDASVALAGADLTGMLIAAGWAAPYAGVGPKPVPPWPRVNPETVPAPM